jgi:hypothetical protein
MVTMRGALLGLIVGASLCLSLVAVGEAAVPRAFVSINGADANPCSTTLPCRSFNRALTVVQAGGEIVVQDSGGYSTGFTITQGVTIDAAGFNASVISIDGSDLCTINAGAGDRVVLRGISFHGANVGGSAITVTQVGSLYVEKCSIAEFTSNGVNMPGGNLFVTDTDVRRCIIGVSVAGSSSATSLVAHNSRFAECVEALQLDATGAVNVSGLLSNCAASLCSLNGYVALSHGAGNTDLTLANCQATGNHTGIAAQTTSTGSAVVRLHTCTVTENGIGIFTSQTMGGLVAVLGTSPGNNNIEGNQINNSTVGTASTLQ